MPEDIKKNTNAGVPAGGAGDPADKKRRLSSAEIAERAYALGEPCAESLGLYLWDCEYVKEGRDYYLRYTVDSEEGLSMDECEAFHRAVEAELDREDLISGAYTLECSSPGIERNIRLHEHYEACVGLTITVRLFTAVDGRKNITGELLSYDDGKIVMKDGKNKLELTLDMISKANVYYDFEEDLKNEKKDIPQQTEQ
ncbi:MAG: ribosome maturation factor RimP [Clostridiales bacterium]|nr:ribosome maturation factor RimP [Clostridiales bacterium]